MGGMLRPVLHSKIHMARCTEAKLDYVGSLVIDTEILDAVGMRVSDLISVANCRNGARYETYVFAGEAGSGVVQVNGAAAHMVEKGDRLIIFHYAQMTDEEYASFHPRVAIMNEDNSVAEVIRYAPRPTPGR